MLLAADDILAQVSPGQRFGGIEHAQLETARERAAQVVIEVALLDKTLLQSFGERHEHLSALQVGAVEHGVDTGTERILMGLVLSLVIEIVDGVAVGHHQSVVAPLVAQDVYEQSVAGAAGTALETLIGAHHLAHIAFLHQCLKGGQIGLPQVAVGGLHVHGVAQRFGSAVYGVVLGTSMGLVKRPSPGPSL